MIVYNVTIKPEKSIADEWLDWLRNEHIPEVLATKCFVDFRILRILEIDETDGPTFAIQYNAESKADYNRYVELHAATLRKKSFDKWGERFIAFRSVMELVQ